MKPIELSRGSSLSTKITLSAQTVTSLPSEFQMIFTVKRMADNDVSDSNAFIQKSFMFPDDFIQTNGSYETTLVLTKEDTLLHPRTYKWNLRFIDNTNSVISDSSISNFIVKPSITQTQEQI
jgi:hypothetical protein